MVRKPHDQPPPNHFDYECFSQTGKWPAEFPRHFFGTGIPTKGLNSARGGLGDANYLAKAAVRYHGAVVTQIQSIWPWTYSPGREKGDS